MCLRLLRQNWSVIQIVNWRRAKLHRNFNGEIRLFQFTVRADLQIKPIHRLNEFTEWANFYIKQVEMEKVLQRSDRITLFKVNFRLRRSKGRSQVNCTERKFSSVSLVSASWFSSRSRSIVIHDLEPALIHNVMIVERRGSRARTDPRRAMIRIGRNDKWRDSGWVK